MYTNTTMTEEQNARMNSFAQILIAVSNAVLHGQSNEEIIAGLEYSLNCEIPAANRIWISDRADEVRAIFNR